MKWGVLGASLAQMRCFYGGCGRGEAAGGGGPSAASWCGGVLGLFAGGRGSGGAGWCGCWRGGCGWVVEKCGRGCCNPMILKVCGAVWVSIEAVSKRWLSGRRRAQAQGEVRRGVVGGAG